jgi:tetratricopeptide (TPR) repeat protein
MKLFLASISLLLVAAACSNGTRSDETGNTDTAAATPEQQLKDAMRRYPDSLKLRDSLIVLYADKGEYDAALSVVNEVLAKDSTIAYFWDVKARLHGFNDDTANAIRSLEKAAELNPLPEYLQSLGYLYADTKNEKALTIGDALIYAKKAASGKEALLIKGMYYSKTGDSKKAIALFDEALAESYTFMFAYREKAITQYNTGRYADAIKTLEKATTLQNDFDEGYYWMGRCYEKLGNVTEAAENYKMAVLYSRDGYAEAADALSRLGVK